MSKAALCAESDECLVDFNFNTYRDDGSQSLYGPGAQCDIGETLLSKARFPKDPIGVIPNLWKNNDK